MDEKIDKAIELLACKITQSIRPEDAMKFTQSALNLAHVKLLLSDKNTEKKGQRLSAVSQA